MHRRILIPITVPILVISGVLCATCIVSVWYTHRMEVNQAQAVSHNVDNLKAAQELEIVLRQMRFHSFIYLADPWPDRLTKIEADDERFQMAINRAEDSAITPKQKQLVQNIRTGFDRYRDELSELRQEVGPGKPLANLARLTDTHPIQHAIDPCQDLVNLNQKALDNSWRQNERVGRQARTVLLFIGILGPLSGFAFGLGLARMVSRSIFRLSVRVQDIAQRLDRDVASVAIVADGNVEGLDRQLQHVLKRVEEVTERTQQHQREMLRAEQLASVGQLAAGVAHEVRNPLTSIKMLIEMALRQRDPKPLTADDLRVIHTEVTRLERTVQGFLDLARLPTPQRAECDLREAVEQAIGLLRARARQQGVEIINRSPPHAVNAFVDCEQLRTVLVNLGLNALDAMPQGGRLEFNLADHPEGARLRVTDTGPGIAPEIAERLFTPFASTKATGTGLGLSISRRIVEEHGGSLTAANQKEGGACFTIRLQHQQSAERAQPDSIPSSPNALPVT
ncbi:MAG TPA: ATP-binding protein [Gemmataceae bacterium]|jgi:signal transduction histidine kinase|nr:ATP-binding protein [Gemmataceae bacterium]